jgi:hypothetical protein
VLEKVLQTLVQIHVSMIQLNPNLGLISNLQLLSQKLKFRLVQDARCRFRESPFRPKSF